MRATWLNGRVERSQRTLGLAIGDFAMIGLFVFLGELRHNGTLASGVETFGQFAIGWLLVGVVAGLYRPGAITRPGRAVLQVVIAWVLAALIGQLIRLLMTPGNLLVPSFLLVSMGFGGAFLAGWRYVAARRYG